MQQLQQQTNTVDAALSPATHTQSLCFGLATGEKPKDGRAVGEARRAVGEAPANEPVVGEPPERSDCSASWTMIRNDCPSGLKRTSSAIVTRF